MSSSQPTLLIVTGHPCTGKTTLARRVATDMGWPLFEKDAIKELLFDQLGWSDRPWSQRLGRASIALLYQGAERTLTAGVSTVIEGNFDPAVSAPRLEELRAHYLCQFAQVVCQAEKTTLFERYRQRWADGLRHPGHIDGSILDELRARLETVTDMAIPVEGPRFTLDTTDFATLDYPALLASVRAAVR